jgi:hypothetical protein
MLSADPPPLSRLGLDWDSSLEGGPGTDSFREGGLAGDSLAEGGLGRDSVPGGGTGGDSSAGDSSSLTGVSVALGSTELGISEISQCRQRWYCLTSSTSAFDI